MTIAVLGAGAGGLAATVELTQAGHEVRLWNRNPVRLDPHRGEGVHYRGALGSGAVMPTRGFTSDLGEAIDDAEVVVVCLPAATHPRLFEELAELRCNQPVVLNPGHTGGALHLRRVFAAKAVALPPVAEFSTLTYVGRVYDNVADITGRAGQVRVGALPGGDVALEWAQMLFPGAAPVADVLASSLSNVNLVLHPPGAILGASWVEATGGAYTFYVEGMTPGVARVLERLDTERLAVAAAFGHALPSLIGEMTAVGTVNPDPARHEDTRAAIRGGAANNTIPAPDSLDHRYYREDFSFGVLPFIALAEVAEVPVPIARSLFEIAAALVPGELTGLGAEQLGIAHLSREDLIASVRS